MINYKAISPMYSFKVNEICLKLKISKKDSRYKLLFDAYANSINHDIRAFLNRVGNKDKIRGE